MLWLSHIGSTISSVFLGFCLSNWWVQWKSGDQKRVNAIKLDDQIEDEIQWMSGYLAQVTNSVKHFDIANKEGFIEAISFVLSSQIHSIKDRLQKLAIEVDRLGFSSQEFLKEKQKRFLEIREIAHELASVLPDHEDQKKITNMKKKFDR